jgi:hypothetical protein
MGNVTDLTPDINRQLQLTLVSAVRECIDIIAAGKMTDIEVSGCLDVVKFEIMMDMVSYVDG